VERRKPSPTHKVKEKKWEGGERIQRKCGVRKKPKGPHHPIEFLTGTTEGGRGRKQSKMKRA